MTRIDYYVLASTGEADVQRLACRIAGKAYGLGHTVYIHAGSAAEAQHIDGLLWTFSDTSFVPHALAETLQDEREIARHPVQIGCNSAPGTPADLLINLAPAVPEFFEQFARLAEVIDADAKRRADGRARYRHYRDRGYQITTHQIDG